MSRGSRNQLGALATTPPAATGGEGAPGLPPVPEGPPEPVESELVALRTENAALRERLESQRAFFEARLQEQAATFDASWEAREREIAAQLQAPPAATVPGHRPRRAVFDASVPIDVRGRRVTYGPGDPVPPHIDPATLPEGAVRYEPEEG